MVLKSAIPRERARQTLEEVTRKLEEALRLSRQLESIGFPPAPAAGRAAAGSKERHD